MGFLRDFKRFQPISFWDIWDLPKDFEGFPTIPTDFRRYLKNPRKIFGIFGIFEGFQTILGIASKIPGRFWDTIGIFKVSEGFFKDYQEFLTDYPTIPADSGRFEDSQWTLKTDPSGFLQFWKRGGESRIRLQ